MGDSDPVDDVNLITTSPKLDIPRSRLHMGSSSSQRADNHARKFSLSVSPSKDRPKGKPFARPSDLVNNNKLGEAVRETASAASAASKVLAWSPSPRRHRKSSVSSTDSIPTNYQIGQFPSLRISQLQIGIAKINSGEGMRVQLTPNNVIQLKSNDETLAQISRQLIKAVAFGPTQDGQQDWIAFKPRGQLDVFKSEMDPASGDDVKRRIVCIASPDDIPSFLRKLHDRNFPTTVNLLTDRTESCLGVLDAKPPGDTRKIPSSGMIDWKASTNAIVDDPVRKRQRIGDSADFSYSSSPATNGQPKPRPVKPRESEGGSPAARPDIRSFGRAYETRVQAAKEREPPPDATALVYGSITLTNSDFARLEDDEFYNDSIVEMYLRYIVDKVRKKDPALADQIHIFTPFFYQKLTEKNKAGIAYDLVKKWTSKVDIFAKKFLIMPINENMHWYIAVIAFPGRMLEFPMTLPILISPDRGRRSATRSQADFFIFEDDDKIDHTPSRAPKRAVDEEEVRRKRVQTYDRSRSVATPESRDVESRAESRAESKAESMDLEMTDSKATSKDVEMASCPPAVETSSTASVIELDESQEKSQELATTQSQREREHLENLFSMSKSQHQPQPRPKPKTKLEAVSSPVEALEERPAPPEELPGAYIIIMDSLGGKPKKVFNAIHEYLLREAKDKKDVDLPPVKNWKGRICKDIYAKVPQQGNHVDCGPYLLHYMETFFNAGENFPGMDTDMDGDSIIADPETFAEVIAAKDDKSRWREIRALSQRERIRRALRKLREEWQEENNHVS